MEHPQNINDFSSPLAGDAAIETSDGKKTYIAPTLEILDIEATRNGPGSTPDSGIDFS